MSDLVRGAVPAPAPTVPGAADAGEEGLLSELRAFVAGAREGILAGEPFPWDTLDDVLDRIADSLEASAELFWRASDPAFPAGVDYLGFHQARVAVMAMRLGACLGYDRWRLVELGTAGCLMDVALWEAAPGAGAPDRDHPDRSADIVRRLRPPRAGLADIVRQHHEREHGQGFPRGLPGSLVHTDARILGLIDHYASLTAPPPPRPALGPHQAVRAVVAATGELFAPSLVRAFLSEVSIFPPGTTVRLSSGELGRVCAVHPERVLRPRVTVTVDASGEPLPFPRTRDLLVEPHLHVAGPVAASAGGAAV
jgi:hypothetical protein